MIISAYCASGDHHLCRPDLVQCNCPCQRNAHPSADPPDDIEGDYEDDRFGAWSDDRYDLETRIDNGWLEVSA